MVNLKGYTKEELRAMSLLEIARLLMLVEKKEMKFGELFKTVAALKGLTEEQRSTKISQFYTDLNVDGNFATNGENMWGLKQWYKNKPKQADDAPRIRRPKRREKVKEDDLSKEFETIRDDIDEYKDDYDEDELDIDIDIEIDDEFDRIYDEEDEEEND